MHELEFTDNEIRIVLNALDFYSRIWIGQYDHMLWDLRWYRNCSQLDALDDTLRRKVLGYTEYHPCRDCASIH